jgi:hypothetical protein
VSRHARNALDWVKTAELHSLLSPVVPHWEAARKTRLRVLFQLEELMKDTVPTLAPRHATGGIVVKPLVR